jgi:crotonobetainyl-CoA:carnitine CoA-transferase CaiB-like acyl-CoA transferase
MPAPHAALASLWQLAGGDAGALSRVNLTGADPVLPSSFRVGTAAQVSIAASALAATELWRYRTGRAQDVSVDMLDAAIECRSERYLQVTGREAPATWDPTAGVYRTGDNRFVRLHTNFRHHRDAVCRVLSCEPLREAVQAALMNWEAAKFEDAVINDGGVVAMMRSREEWLAHPQGVAVAQLPLLEIEKIGEAAPRPLPAVANGDQPLSGLRVLDFSRIIAGPVAGRTLAAHGAEVMLISSPKLPFIEWAVIDTGRGKRSAFVDLETSDGRAALEMLLSQTDIVSQAYRSNSLAGRGLAPEDLARRHPGIVCVTLTAYGRTGPWSARRGFDSLVQTTTGFNHAEGVAAGVDGPRELPMQILDHATGYLMAFGAIMAKLRQAREGGSWHVRVSLAQTSHWLWTMGRVADGLQAFEPARESIDAWRETSPSGFGELHAIRHSAKLSETPARWTQPSVPPGNDPARWPKRNA